MPREFEHLAQRNDMAVLKEADDRQRPSTDVAPFELEEAYPLADRVGTYLTSPNLVRDDDGDPLLVLNHTTNPELTVWVNRYLTAESTSREFFVLSCHDHDKAFYYEVPQDTVESVLRQAMDDVYWGIGSLNDDLLEALLDGI